MNARRRRRADPVLDGVLLVDKPSGPTSHDVVQWVRWALGVRRVGHCGTLDPMATGLLVVTVGMATKLVPLLTGQDKVYRATVVLGQGTTTGDAQGTVVAERPVDESTFARIPTEVAMLRGEHQLPPPAYSAIHVDGRRAHELARAGRQVELPPRPMTVTEVTPHAAPRRVGATAEVEMSLRVSKGTYIRSLARALGDALGVPAHLGALHRTASGTLALSEAPAVQGLIAQRLPSAEDRPPRFRIGLSSVAEDKAAMAAHLRDRLISPVDAIPLPVWRVQASDSGSRALTRLASGQAIAADDPGLPAGPVPPQLAVAPASADEAGLVVVTHAQGQLRPTRVIVAVARS